MAPEAWQPLLATGLTLESETLSGLKAASGKQRPMLKGEVHGNECQVHIRSDAVHFAHTRVSAKVATLSDSKVGVHPSPAGLLGAVRSWLGQDIEVGDEEFDEAFLITGKPEAAAKSLLTPSVREKVAALASGPFAGFTFAEGEVAVLFQGVVLDAAVLQVALDLAVETARAQV